MVFMADAKMFASAHLSSAELSTATAAAVFTATAEQGNL